MNVFQATQVYEQAYTYAILRSLKSVQGLEPHVTMLKGTPFYYQEVAFCITPALGAFRGIKLTFLASFPLDFPTKAPKLVATQQVLHPNILASQKVCMNLLYTYWRSDRLLSEVLLALLCLLEEPNFDDYANEEAHTLWLKGCWEEEARKRILRYMSY